MSRKVLSAALVAAIGCTLALVLGGCRSTIAAPGHNGSSQLPGPVWFDANGDLIKHSPAETRRGHSHADHDGAHHHHHGGSGH